MVCQVEAPVVGRLQSNIGQLSNRKPLLIHSLSYLVYQWLIVRNIRNKVYWIQTREVIIDRINPGSGPLLSLFIFIETFSQLINLRWLWNPGFLGSGSTMPRPSSALSQTKLLAKETSVNFATKLHTSHGKCHVSGKSFVRYCNPEFRWKKTIGFCNTPPQKKYTWHMYVYIYI